MTHTGDTNKKIKILENLNGKFKKLIKLKAFLIDSDKRIAFGNVYLEKLSNVDTSEKLTNEIEQLITNKNKLMSIKEEYNNNSNEINIIRKHIDIERSKTSMLLKEYKKLLSKLEICPMCLSKINSDTINNIINNYK